jgi:hypothetical protein
MYLSRSSLTKLDLLDTRDGLTDALCIRSVLVGSCVFPFELKSTVGDGFGGVDFVVESGGRLGIGNDAAGFDWTLVVTLSCTGASSSKLSIDKLF